MRRWLLAAAVIGLWVWWRGDAPAAHDGERHAAVLADGFALYDGHRVVELDRKGKQRKQHVLAHDGELRLVGPSNGPAVAWVESKKVRLVRASTGKGSVWGNSVRMLCEGAATNDERFAVAWLEANDTIWFVHGDTRNKRTDEQMADEAVGLANADRKVWCGVASAHDLVALFWRDSDRLFIQTCTRKKCSGLPATVSLDRRETLLGFGCVRNACLLGVRDHNGASRLQFVTESGATKWTKPLPTKLLEVSIVGAGENAFAVGFVGEHETEVGRVDRKGVVTPLWAGPPSKHAPALAWSRDQLLVGHPAGATTLVAFPR
ncbi:MAG TPA: hypothetical protein VFV99_31930 [Kofleriaceae bacterium]|nr:hypothetical protein [Kofleriaceae bacterium]